MSNIIVISIVHCKDYIFFQMKPSSSEVKLDRLVVVECKADHGLVDGIRRLVRKDASRQTRDDLGDPRLIGCLQNVVIHQQVVSLNTNTGTKKFSLIQRTI